MRKTRQVRRSGRLAAGCVIGASVLSVGAALGQVATTPTMDPGALGAALNPSGLTINSVTIHNGVAGQFGTFTNFELLPVTIRPGIVLSSGDVTDLSPIAGATDPDYDPASPPGKVNSQMTPEPDTGGTPEFDAFGFTSGNIENFSGGYDVAAIRVDFSIEDDTTVKFDFIFGSVEYPFWTSQFTDSFLVFLDGTTPADQITLDHSGNAVQVGSSFAGLETTADQNCAFSDPHGLIHHLTTTTPMLGGGDHFLIFEIGDVNDHILDSAVFISNLRAEAGTPGTDETDDPPYADCPNITGQPTEASVCGNTGASFTVTAGGPGPLVYEWQIRTASNTWVALDAGPVALPCGGLVQADTPNAPSTALAITACQGTNTYRVRCRISNACGDVNSNAVTLTIAESCCDTIDFNNDGLFPDTADIDDFLSVFSGGPCSNDPNCGDIDYNNDGLFPDTLDIDSLLSVFSGGPCL